MNSTTHYTLRTFWRHASAYPWAIAAVLSGVIIGSAVDIYTPFLYKGLFDYVGGQAGPGTDPYHLILLIAGANSVAWLAWRISLFTLNFLEPRVMADLLATGFRYLHKHSYSFFNDTFAGSLVRRLARYPDAFEDIADQLVFNILQILIRVGSVLVILYFRYWQLAALVSVWAVLYTFVNYRFAVYKMKFSLERAEVDSQLTGHISDTVSNNMNMKLFGGEEFEQETFGRLNAKLFTLRRFSWNLDQFSESIQGAFMVGLELAVLWIALSYWKKRLITVGDFALLQAYLIQLFTRLSDFGRNIQRIYRSLSDAEEMSQILTTPHEVRDLDGAGTLSVPRGAISFTDVRFQYDPEKPILSGFTLTVQAREKVALIGPSGGGKSTITKLLFRFLDIQGGSISIDGQDISGVTQQSLRAAIALVPQEPILFHRSLMENIRYARPAATDEEVVQAAKQAHCSEFIDRFPEKYETLVGERGVKLSGGERQRIAIARAILKDAPILVLDEATSSLDSESERFIQDSLRHLMRQKTTIVIAHRLSTIMEMDRIVVLEGGRIIEEGRHEELIKAQDGTYQKLWEIQAGGFGE